MKKIFVGVLIFMVILYAMPIVTVGMQEQKLKNDIFYTQTEQKKDIHPSKQEDDNRALGYDKKTEVMVLLNGTVETMSVYEYLIGVVAAEMPASFPVEALKAQAVAARSYMLYKIDALQNDSTHNGAQLCDDFNHCTAFYDVAAEGQRLWGDDFDLYYEKIKSAVESTDGIVAMSDGEVIAAVFHSASGGYTESAENVWGNSYSYLVSVPTWGGSASPRYYDTKVIKKEDFKKILKAAYPKITFENNMSDWFSDIMRSDSGSVISLKIGGIEIKGTEIRSIFELNSTNFTIELSNDEILFNTVGTGHGVGLSQYGARAMALDGAYFDEILCHYYSGIQLVIKN